MDSFKKACDEFRYLRERGYPEKATLTIVANRHRLSRMQRNCLFRGIVAAPLAAQRKERLVPLEKAAAQALGVDWYNVLITVESYLNGNILFISEDGIVRDASATHGSYRTGRATPRAMEEIVAAMRVADAARVDAYLDAPIAWSGLMADELRRLLSSFEKPCDVFLVHSADYPLKNYDGIVATSDSAIMDNAGRVLDLARWVMQRSFGVTPPPVVDLFP